MANRKVYHVTPNPGGGWQGKAEGAQRASVVADNKEEVVERTTELARNQMPSQVIIHKSDGTIQDERTYQDDPSPPEG